MFKIPKKSIFIGFSEVAGYYSAIIPHLESLGYSISFLSFGKNLYEYPCEANPSRRQTALWELCRWSSNSSTLFPTSIIRKIICMIGKIFIAFPLMIRSDAILLNYSGTTFFYLDVLLLRILNKRVVYFYHGSDSRPPYLNGKYIYPPIRLRRILFLTILMRMRLLCVQALASDIIVAPTASQFFTRRCINYFRIGMPKIDNPISINTRYLKKDRSLPFRVLHAPSCQNKGTNFVNEAIESLKKDGLSIEYTELIGCKNNKVLTELADSDLVIDELWSDVRMAGLCIEAASVGTPCLLGSNYTREQWQIDNELEEPPVFLCNWDKLKTEIYNLYFDFDCRYSMHKRLLSDEVPNASFIASQIIMILFPDSQSTLQKFYFNPKSVSYIHGAGAPPEHVEIFIHYYVSKFSIYALLLPFRSFSRNKINEILRTGSIC